MSRYIYEIDDVDGFAIKAYDTERPNEDNKPFLYQPNWPDNTPWASHEEAELWAQRLVAMMEDPKNGRPGGSPSEPWIEWTPEEEPIEE